MINVRKLVEVKYVGQLVKFLSVLKNCKMFIEHLNVSDPALRIKDARVIDPLLVFQNSQVPMMRETWKQKK